MGGVRLAHAKLRDNAHPEDHANDRRNAGRALIRPAHTAGADQQKLDTDRLPDLRNAERLRSVPAVLVSLEPT